MVQDQDTFIAVIDVFEDLGKSRTECEALVEAPESMCVVYRVRYSKTLKQIQTHPIFLRAQSPIVMTPIHGLLGSRGEKYVFGILAKLDGNTWNLEDLDSTVKLRLGTEMEPSVGLFCEGCCVLAHGVYIDGIFLVYSFC